MILLQALATHLSRALYIIKITNKEVTEKNAARLA